MTLTRRAAIAQSTGEDWDNVQLSLSTAKPRLGAAALFGGAAALCLGGAAWVWFALAGAER